MPQAEETYKRYYRRVPWRADPQVLITKLSLDLEIQPWQVIGIMEWLWMQKEQYGDEIAFRRFEAEVGDHGNAEQMWNALKEHGVLTEMALWHEARIRDWRE